MLLIRIFNTVLSNNYCLNSKQKGHIGRHVNVIRTINVQRLSKDKSFSNFLFFLQVILSIKYIL